MLQTSVLFRKNYNATCPVVINQGGTSAGKTYAIQQVLFCIACKKEKQVITVVGQDIPNLKAGALRDALKIYNSLEHFMLMVKSYNKTDRIFEFHNGTIIEFRSFSDAQDAKSGKRDYLFVNEANGITWDIYTELALRTRERIFIDYNPNYNFWVHDRLIGQPGVQLIISDHRHNPFLTERERDKIEKLKLDDYELWKVYARGLTGKIRDWCLMPGIFAKRYPTAQNYWLPDLILASPTTKPAALKCTCKTASFGLMNYFMKQALPIPILIKN